MEQPPVPCPTLKEHPTFMQRAVAAKIAREAREAAALRANLLRRKMQARSRGAPTSADDATAAIPDTDDKG